LSGVSSDFYTLDTMNKLMKLVGSPQDKCKVLHVAGTSGKSSTAYYLASLLRANGATVGLCVSPHIIEVNERVQINLEPMPEKQFCESLGEFWDLATSTGLQPSYFEMLVAFAFWEFARIGVDYVVMEVGVGGLLDGTNVVTREDKVCVITDIGLDHTKLLGSTIPEIASHKAGIIQHRNKVFMYEQGVEVMEVVKERCALTEAVLHTTTPTKELENLGLPLFQERNMHLAQSVVEYIAMRDGRKPLDDTQIRRAARIIVIGRMEIFHLKGKVLIIDGAHNEQKMTALVQSIQAAYPNQPVGALISAVHGQDERWRRSLGVLMPTLNSCIVTSFQQAKDDRIKSSVAAEEIGDYLKSANDLPLVIESDVREAFKLLMQSEEPILLVTGSLYLLGDVLKLIADSTPVLPAG
jgi:dihydrofolate synthase/folylpolyglutamate synthase